MEKNKEYIKIEKWCIKRTPETHQKINEWFSNKIKSIRFTARIDFHQGFGLHKSHWKYLHYPMYNGKTLWTKKIRGYTEITYEEFEQYILKPKITFIKIFNNSQQDYVIRKLINK